LSWRATLVLAKAGSGPPRRRHGNVKELLRLHPGQRKKWTLYIGVTNDLLRRVWEHREGLLAGFTKKYAVKRLVHFEEFGDIALAIHRETRLKKWKRRWKMELIEKANPDWRDLYDAIVG
jgi:putative endonuclease